MQPAMLLAVRAGTLKALLPSISVAGNSLYQTFNQHVQVHGTVPNAAEALLYVVR